MTQICKLTQTGSFARHLLCANVRRSNICKSGPISLYLSTQTNESPVHLDLANPLAMIHTPSDTPLPHQGFSHGAL